MMEWNMQQFALAETTRTELLTTLNECSFINILGIFSYSQIYIGFNSTKTWTSYIVLRSSI